MRQRRRGAAWAPHQPPPPHRSSPLLSPLPLPAQCHFERGARRRRRYEIGGTGCRRPGGDVCFCETLEVERDRAPRKAQPQQGDDEESRGKGLTSAAARASSSSSAGSPEGRGGPGREAAPLAVPLAPRQGSRPRPAARPSLLPRCPVVRSRHSLGPRGGMGTAVLYLAAAAQVYRQRG